MPIPPHTVQLQYGDRQILTTIFPDCKSIYDLFVSCQSPLFLSLPAGWVEHFVVLEETAPGCWSAIDHEQPPEPESRYLLALNSDHRPLG